MTTSFAEELKAYNESLDHALSLYLSEGRDSALRKHHALYRVPLHSNQHIQKAAWYKAATGRTTLAIGLRRKAKLWLDQHNYESWDDGDLDVR